MNIQMIVTYVVIDSFCIIMACVMGAHLNSDFGSESEVKALKNAMTAYCGFLIFGLLWLLTQNGYLAYNAAVAWIANTLSLFLLNLMAFYWFVFAITKLSRNRAFSNRKVYYLSLLPIAAAALLCVSSPWTGWAFTITADGQYERGPLFLPASSIGYLYDVIVCVYAIICAFREKQTERKKLCLVIGLFIVFPMAAGAIQLIVTGTPILAPAILTAMFLVFVTIDSSQIYNDALTGLNNRKRAYAYLEKELSSANGEHATVVYMIDVDNFKLINDQQGHVEGDRALKTFADVLVLLAAKYDLFVARYGGDEFLIVDSSRNLAAPDAVVEDMNRELQRLCAERDIRYALTVSTGYAETTDRGARATDVIALADERLYAAKSMLHGEVK